MDIYWPRGSLEMNEGGEQVGTGLGFSLAWDAGDAY